MCNKAKRQIHILERPSSSSRYQKRSGSALLYESSSTKPRERVWYPSSKSTSQRPSKYFESTSNKHQARDETESETVSQRQRSSDRVQIRTSDPKQKRRNANAESKVKSAWEPTVTGLHQPTGSESRSGTPVKQRTDVTPTNPKEKSISRNGSHISNSSKQQDQSRSPSPIEQPPPTRRRCFAIFYLHVHPCSVF